MKITYTSVDGARSSRTFKTVKNARVFAFRMVGPQELAGGDYAVSNDGVGKITWSGVTRAELFGLPPSSVRLNAETTFYRRATGLYCRQAGMTYDHERQLFGRVVLSAGGWALQHVDQLPLFDTAARYETIEAAMAAAKSAQLDYLDYCENDAD